MTIGGGIKMTAAMEKNTVITELKTGISIVFGNPDMETLS